MNFWILRCYAHELVLYTQRGLKRNWRIDLFRGRTILCPILCPISCKSYYLTLFPADIVSIIPRHLILFNRQKIGAKIWWVSDLQANRTQNRTPIRFPVRFHAWCGYRVLTVNQTRNCMYNCMWKRTVPCRSKKSSPSSICIRIGQGIGQRIGQGIVRVDGPLGDV